MGTRYYSLDVAKGIGILLMILSHPFLGSLTGVDSPFFLNIADGVPKVVWYCILVPLGVIGNMESYFVFISSICTTLSFLDISKKGWKVVWRYLMMKFVFGILLRAIECFWVSWSTDYDFVETRTLQLPIVPIPFTSGVIDCIGFNSWSISFVVYLLRLIPFLRDYRIQIYILYFLSVILTVSSRWISEGCLVITDWCKAQHFTLLEYCFSKMSSGADQIPQLWPFGLLGASIAIVLHSGVTLLHLIWFSSIVFCVNCIIGMVYLYSIDDFVTELFEPFKPEGFEFISMGVEAVLILVLILLIDDKRRSALRRRGSLKRTSYLRKLSVLSFTIFILQKWFNKHMLVIFEFFFGKLIDSEKKELLWTWPVIVLFMVVLAFAAIGITELWKYFEFRCCMEHQVNQVMLWLFDRQYSKADYKAIIYGPLKDVQTEIDCGHRDEEPVEGRDDRWV